MTQIHIQITARRRALRMSQNHLASAAEVSRSTIQRVERGQPISDESMRSLCAVLDITLGQATDDASIRLGATAGAEPAPADYLPDHEPPPVADVPDPIQTAPLDIDLAVDVDDEPMPVPYPSKTPMRSRWAMAIPVGLGVAIFGIVWSARESSIASDISAAQDRENQIQRVVSAPAFPVTPTRSLMACATAVSVKGCIEGEEKSRGAGALLWQAALPGVRRECLTASRNASLEASTLTGCLDRYAEERNPS